LQISDTALKQILREYDEKQLKASRDLRMRMQKIEEELPELREIDSRIAQLSVNMAVMRIKGQKTDMQAYRNEKQILARKKQALLQSAGYQPQDLEPVYECPVCRDTGFVNGVKCNCFKDRIIDLLYDQSNIREILQREYFQNYTLDYYSDRPLPGRNGESPLSLAKNALQCAWDFVHHFSQTSDNLFITGGTGTGKTFLCNCIAREILNEGYSVIYLSAFKFFQILRDQVFGDRKIQEADHAPNQIPDHDSDNLHSCDLLIIDDLGTELTNTLTQSVFFDCINERLLRNKHTIISTNLSIEQISKNYSERVFSRIAEKYTYIELLGQDIRISKKMEG